jgi:methylphosphotriester-DNA--protein-cysteine methyltransferase
MAYRQNDLGLLVKLSPIQASEKIAAAFEAIDHDEEGRVVEQAAEQLGVSATTLKRFLKQLDDVGHPVSYDRKRPAKKAV